MTSGNEIPGAHAQKAEPKLVFEPGAFSSELLEALVEELVVPAMVKAELARREGRRPEEVAQEKSEIP